MNKELVMINRECDRKNRFYNIIGWPEEKIKEKIDSFDTNKWFAIRR